MVLALASIAPLASQAAAQPVSSPDPPSGYGPPSESYGLGYEPLTGSGCDQYGEIFPGPAKKLAVRLSIATGKNPADRKWTICELTDRGARSYPLGHPEMATPVSPQPLADLGAALNRPAMIRDDAVVENTMRTARAVCLRGLPIG
jgi:hypothetical protein